MENKKNELLFGCRACFSGLSQCSAFSTTDLFDEICSKIHQIDNDLG